MPLMYEKKSTPKWYLLFFGSGDKLFDLARGMLWIGRSTCRRGVELTRGCTLSSCFLLNFVSGFSIDFWNFCASRLANHSTPSSTNLYQVQQVL